MLGFLTGKDTDRPIRRVGHGQQELHLPFFISPLSPLITARPKLFNENWTKNS